MKHYMSLLCKNPMCGNRLEVVIAAQKLANGDAGAADSSDFQLTLRRTSLPRAWGELRTSPASLHSSRKARLNLSVSGLTRNEIAVRICVVMKTSTNMPGLSLLTGFAEVIFNLDFRNVVVLVRRWIACGGGRHIAHTTLKLGGDALVEG